MRSLRGCSFLNPGHQSSEGFPNAIPSISAGELDLPPCFMFVCRLTGLCVLLTSGRAAESELRIEVDARDLPRRLLHTSLQSRLRTGPARVSGTRSGFPARTRPAVRWTRWEA